MKQNLTKIKFVVAAIATTLIFTACNSKYEKAASGMTYKISHGSGKEKIKQGQVVKFFIEYKLAEKDTILNSNFGKMPGYMPVDTARLPKYNFTEIITKLAVGDKVDFTLYVDTLKRLGQIPAYDNLFKKGGSIKGRVEILKVFLNDSLAQADFQAETKKDNEKKEAASKGLLEKQIKELKDYAAKNNIKVVQSPLGVLVEVQNEGTGVKADSGKHAMLMYKGYLLNGKVFDSNMGADAKRKDAIDVAVGMHNTIPGFEDAMKYFGKGGKGRLLIPSPLAYGDRDMGDIPANSNLIFDIEVKDVLLEKPKPILKIDEPADHNH